MIFTYKLYCIGFCIGMGYDSVAYLRDNPGLASMCCLACLDIGTVYSLVYQKGFEVQSDFTQVVEAMTYSNSKGIKVGHFHTLERTSTPMFLQFVVENVVGMLVSYG